MQSPVDSSSQVRSGLNASGRPQAQGEDSAAAFLENQREIPVFRFVDNEMVKGWEIVGHTQ